MRHGRLLAFGVWLAVAGCAARDDADPHAVRVLVRSDASGVHATYALPAPVARLALSPAAGVRASTWTFEERGATLDAEGRSIAFDRPTDRFTVTLRPFDGSGQRDRVYSPVVPTGDGAVTVQAGYLAVDGPVGRTVVSVDAPDWIVGGVPHRGLARAWTSDQPPAYLLIGAFPIVRTAHYALSTDPAMPAWMRTEIDDTAHLAFAEYRRLLGPASTITPWVLATYGDRGATGLSLHGDTLDDFVRLDFSGSGWSTSTDQESGLRLFVAHEVFHLWNSGPHGQGGTELPVWILEGGADAAAFDLVRRTRRIPDDDAAAIEAQALAACAAADGVSLKDKLAAQRGTAPYACGAAMFYFVEHAARREGRRTTALDLWRGLVGDRGADGAVRYAPRDFVAAAGRLGTDDLRTTVEALVDSDEDWNALLGRLSPRLGLREVPDAEAPPRVAMTIAGRLVFQLMKGDCGRGYGFWTEPDALRVDPSPSCRNFDRPVRLTGALGHDFRRHAAAAYRAAEAVCRDGGIVTIDNDGDHVLRVPCGTPLKPLSTTFGFATAAR